MRSLSIERQAAGPMPEAVAITALVTLTRGEPFYSCNPFAELREAWAAGEPFEAHEVRGLAAHARLINPKFIVSIEARS